MQFNDIVPHSSLPEYVPGMLDKDLPQTIQATRALEILKRLDVAVLDPLVFDRALEFFCDERLESSPRLSAFDLASFIQTGEALLFHEMVLVPTDYATNAWPQAGRSLAAYRLVYKQLESFLLEVNFHKFAIDLGHAFPELVLNAFHTRSALVASNLQIQRFLVRLPEYLDHLMDHTFPFVSAREGNVLGNFRVVIDLLLTHHQVAELCSATYYPSPGTQTFLELTGHTLSSAVAKRLIDRCSTALNAESHELEGLGLAVREELRLPFWVSEVFGRSAAPRGVLNNLLDLRYSNEITAVRTLAKSFRAASRSGQVRLLQELKRQMEAAVRGDRSRTSFTRTLSLLPAVWSLDSPRLIEKAGTIEDVVQAIRGERHLLTYLTRSLDEITVRDVFPELDCLYGSTALSESLPHAHDFAQMHTSLPVDEEAVRDLRSGSRRRPPSEAYNGVLQRRNAGTLQECERSVSDFIEEVREARRNGRLERWFRASDVRRACPEWAAHTYFNFLPKHRDGNPGGYTVYFIRRKDGMYRLITE